MSSIDETLAPRALSGVDFKSLKSPLTPEEFFVLSRVDGSMTVAQLCSVSGLGRPLTLECIESLWKNGLIELPGQIPPAPASSTAASPAPAGAASETAEPHEPGEDDLSEAILTRFPVAIEDFHFDRELLEQSVELDDDFKREVVFVHAQLDEVDYYQLLGVDVDCGRRELRGAYFSMSKRYHPDRFFRKVLGDYGMRIEKIFQRITRAYQTLSNRNKRAEYNAFLEQHRQPVPLTELATTPLSQRSEPIEEVASERKREMAFQLLVRRGDAHLERDDVGAALREFRKALTLKRDHALALRVAQSLKDRGNHLDDAVAFARAAHKIEARSVDALRILGELYIMKQSPSDAIYHLERALELRPDDADILAHLQQLRA
ncbi:hypothetical protein EA187_02015 [Lujinxingia sediminis]|uniref:J domain-containing protein n=1 Tax=Lujinxingia sediminis TaxID=2480984 RepID=A0ABY0CX77_9DELT|nr:J domain-containing protein [Lujinxingia sediminis]RVU48235.1 hypothetical protein EA187_02015 [Lujinxingia sediminis]